MTEQITVPELRLIARDPAELHQSQQKLIAWCSAKLDEASKHVDELITNLMIANRNGWKTSVLATAVRREKQRVTFYDKIMAALNAGFYIIPNFDADVFAVRTDRR